MGDNTTLSQPIGHVTTLQGIVQAESVQGIRDLSSNSPLFKGDMLITLEDSQVEIQFADDTHLSQGANSRISLDSYVYDADEGSNSKLLLNMVEGTFRCVTGKIVEQNPENFILKSPLATLGIRGTTVVSEIHDGVEKHGAEEISPGKAMVVQDSFGTVRLITQPQSIIDFVPGNPIDMARAFTPAETTHFRMAAPLSEHDTPNHDDIPATDNPDDAPGLGDDQPNTNDDQSDMDSPADHGQEDAPQPTPQPVADTQSAGEMNNVVLVSQITEAPKEIIKTASPATDITTTPSQNMDTTTTVAITSEMRPNNDPVTDQTGMDGGTTDPSFTGNEDTVLPPTLVNHPPQAGDGSFTLNEDSSLTATVNARDSDNNPLTYSLKSGALNGMVQLNADGSFTYSPNADFNGIDRFTFQVSDGKGGTDEARVTLNVNPVNDPPQANSLSTTVDEDGNVTAKVTAIDIDANAHLSYSRVTDAAHGQVTMTPDGTFTYTPSADYHGMDRFTFAVTDDKGASHTGTVNLTVTPINDTPEAMDARVDLNEDTAYVGTLGTYDVDGDTLTHDLVQNTQYGNLSLSADGTFTYTPDEDFSGKDAFTYSVTDSAGATDTATMTMVVAPVNDGPMATDMAITTPEDQVYDGTLDTMDRDDEALGHSIVQDARYGAVSLTSDGLFTYTPDENFSGEDTFAYSVTDSSGGSDTGTVTVTVTPVNDTPKALGMAVTTTEDQAYSGTLDTSDADGDTLTHGILQAPRYGTVSLTSDGRFTYTPNEDFAGEDTFTYSVTDSVGEASSATVKIKVYGVNDPPVTEGISITLSEDATGHTATVTATDVDGDTLSFAQKTAPTHGNLTMNGDGSFTYIPNADYHGSDSFTYTVTDTKGGMVAGTVNVTVTPVNDVPMAHDGDYTTMSGTTLNGNLTATDADNDTLSFSTATAPSSGIVIVNSSGGFEYTSNAGFIGSDTFTYTVADGHGGTDTGVVGIVVTAPPNAAPLATDLSASTKAGVSLSETVSATDPDGDPITYAKLTDPIHGTITMLDTTTGAFTYEPDVIYWGKDIFTFSATDSHGTADTGSVFIEVGSSSLGETINGTSASEIIYGLDGDDTIDPGTGADFVSGDDGDDAITIMDLTADDTVDGGPGHDTLTFMDITAVFDELSNVKNIETIVLSNQPTTIDIDAPESLIAPGMILEVDGSAQFSGAIDWDQSGETDGGQLNFTGGFYQDTVTGGTSDDTIAGGPGDDDIYGGPGNDFLDGQSEYDELHGGDGNDSIEAGSQDDYLFGDAGNDTLLGEDGNDFLDGGDGNDTLTGGFGADVFSYAETGNFGDIITDFNASEGDEIKFKLSATPPATAGTYVHLVSSVGMKTTTLPVSPFITVQQLYSASNLAAFTNAVKSVSMHQTNDCLAFGLIGTAGATNRKLIFAVGHNTNADPNVDTVTAFTVATLQGITGVGPSSTQIDAYDIIIY